MDLFKPKPKDKPKEEEQKTETTSPVDRRMAQAKDTIDKEKAKKFISGFKGTL